MKNRKTVTCLLLALILLFGNVLSVSAEETPNAETVNDEDNIFYEGLNQNTEGKYEYSFEYLCPSGNGTYYIDRYTLVSDTPFCVIKYRLDTDVDTIFRIQYANSIEESTSYKEGYYCYKSTKGVSGTHGYYSKDDKLLWEQKDSYGMDFAFDNSSGKAYFRTTAPVFSDFATAKKYLETLDDSEVTNKKPVKAEKPDLYLKNIGWKTEAASGMGGKEDCVCMMTWDTDNLNENIFLNVRVDAWYQHYVLGKKVSGTYDAIEKKQTDEFISTTWSHGYLYKLDLLNGSFMYDYLTFPMLYGNTQEDLNNIYNGGVTSMYLQLVEVDKTTNTEYSGPWIRVNFKENSVSYPDISDISGGSINPDTGEFIVDPDSTDYGESGYGVNGETGNVVQPGEVDLSSIDEIIPWFISKLKSMIGTLGEFPSLVAQVFSFLPDIIIWFIGVGIVIVIILRILGR